MNAFIAVIFLVQNCLIIASHGLETATEIKAPPPTNITELGNQTFKKTAEFLNGELSGL